MIYFFDDGMMKQIKLFVVIELDYWYIDLL